MPQEKSHRRYNTDLRQGRYNSPIKFCAARGKRVDSDLPAIIKKEDSDNVSVGNSENRHKTLPLPAIRDYPINRERAAIRYGGSLILYDSYQISDDDAVAADVSAQLPADVEPLRDGPGNLISCEVSSGSL